MNRILLIVFCSLWISCLSAENELRLMAPDIKIRPADGTVVGFSGVLLSELPELAVADKAGLRRLPALPGETLAFQWVTGGESLESIQIDNADLDVRIYQIGSVFPEKNARENYPDLMLPMPKGEAAGNFRALSDPLLLKKAAAWQVFWVDIRLPEKIALSEAQIHFKFLAAGGKQLKKATLQLDIAARPLPEPSLQLDLNEYGDKYLRPFKKDDPGMQHATEQRAFRMAAEHHGVLNVLPYRSQRGIPHDMMAPTLLNDDLLNPQLDWQAFDARFGGYFDGSALPDGKPLRHFYLPFNPNWPAPFGLYQKDRDRYEKIWAAFAAAYRQHFLEKGWTRTTFQVYCNQKPNDNNNIPWNLDEPKGIEDYRALRYYCDLTQAVFPADDPVTVRFRMDISHFYCDKHRGSMDKDLRVNGGAPVLAPIDIWAVAIHSLAGESARRAARERVADGKSFWVYGDTPMLHQPAHTALLSIYRAWLDGFNGFMCWKSTLRLPGQDDGRDYIFYAGKAAGQGGIFSSLRLKLLRQAIDDTRIMQLALEAGLLTREALQQRIADLKYGDAAMVLALRSEIMGWKRHL